MSTIAETWKDLRTLTFDCYGTLIDWDAGLHNTFRAMFGDVAVVRRAELFDAYVQVEAEVEADAYRSYRDVLTLTLERLAKRLQLPLSTERRGALAEMLPNWRPFPDTNAALVRLKERFRLGVLSNVDRDLFAETATHFPVAFDFVITAQDVGSYKPSLNHFQKCIAEQGPPNSILHVAQSLYHDGQAARDVGLAFVWINRYRQTNDTMVRPLAEFSDLASFAEAVCCRH